MAAKITDEIVGTCIIGRPGKGSKRFFCWLCKECATGGVVGNKYQARKRAEEHKCL